MSTPNPAYTHTVHRQDHTGRGVPVASVMGLEVAYEIAAEHRVTVGGGSTAYWISSRRPDGTFNITYVWV